MTIFIILLNSCHLSEVSFSNVDVLEAISQLKPKKSDSDEICSEHLRYASSSVAKYVANFFTSVVRHGYMPHCLRDCVFLRAERTYRLVKIIVQLHSLSV